MYVCQNCGHTSSKWSGRCPSCDQWNTFVEQLPDEPTGRAGKGSAIKVQTLSEGRSEAKAHRLSTNIKEFDDVLGGGIVRGSVTLLAGQPGIGKSTLLLQIAHTLAQTQNILYVSGEESLQQIALRSKRLGQEGDDLHMAISNSTNDILATIKETKYDVVIIDSIQTLALSELNSVAGSVAQITNSTAVLTQAAKRHNTALIIVGHVTKEGTIAGPKVLEHVVDVVLQFEGDRYGGFKVVRAMKNRFGSTNETAIFDMNEEGLMPVDNPSELLLKERQKSDGSIVLATVEGTRPLLVEVQALVTTTSFGYPKRAASGIELNRLNLLIAMLTRRTKLNLGDKDVYVNVVGGLKITDPGADLAVCMAIASAAKGMQLQDGLVVFGEVGLSGEIRHVPFVDKRIEEAKKLGFKAALAPGQQKKNTFVKNVRTVQEALNTYLEKEK